MEDSMNLGKETKAAAKPGPEAKSEGAALVVVSLALMADMMLYGIAVPVLPALARDYGASSASLGFLFGVYAVTMIALMPVVGIWADRAGPRRPLLAGLIGLAASTALFAYAPGYAFLVAARALQGASAAVSWTAGLALLAASFPAERRGAAMGKALSAMSLGTLLGPVAGGFLFEHLGRAAPFLFGAAIAAADAAARIILVRRPPAGDRSEARPASVLRAEGIVACLAIAALGSAVVAALEPVLPQLTSSEFGLGASGIGLAFSAATLASVLAYPIAGAAADRLGAKRSAALGAAVAAIGYAGLAFAGSSLASAACLTIAAIGAAFVVAPTAGLVAKAAESIRPPAYGTAYSLYNVAYSAGLAAGPLASAFAYGSGGIRLVAAAGAAVLAAAAIALASMRREARAKIPA
jgi:MFS transporter, DHA1 family, solute carrier family 18 (vesicular amine transporter), member 1/2